MIPRTLLALTLAALAAIPGTAAAAPRGQNFVAHLTGEAEVPPRDTPATGQATFRLSPDGSTISYRLIASNIDNVVGAHVHCPATEEQTAGVAVPLSTSSPGEGSADGVNPSGTFNPSTLCPNSTMTVLEAMRAGLAYVNVHTNDGDTTPNEGPGDFPGGEIRGQIEPRGPGR